MGSLLAALGLVFVAELGDKTQLVALGLGARHRLVPVLVGVALAYAATNLLSVVVGALLGAALPTRALGLGGGVLFIAFGAWTVWSEHEDDDLVLPGFDRHGRRRGACSFRSQEGRSGAATSTQRVPR